MQKEEQLKKRKLRILTVIAEQVDPLKNGSAVKNLEIFERIAGIKHLAVLEDETLQEIVDGLKDTPMDEPKLFKFFEENDPVGILKYIKGLKGNKGLDFNAMDGLEVGRFISNIRFKILEFSDEAGNMKSTKNTKDIKMPSFFEAIEHKKLTKETEGSEATEYALKISGLDVEKLSDWEKELVEANIQYHTIDILKTMSGGFY